MQTGTQAAALLADTTALRESVAALIKRIGTARDMYAVGDVEMVDLDEVEEVLADFVGELDDFLAFGGSAAMLTYYRERACGLESLDEIRLNDPVGWPAVAAVHERFERAGHRVLTQQGESLLEVRWPDAMSGPAGDA